VSVFDQDRARIGVPELEGRLCFTFTPNEADERVQRRATEMLATLKAALAEYRREQWERWFNDVGELIAGAAAAVLAVIARVWAWGVRTYRSEPALVDHSIAVATGAAVLTVLALTARWAWGWPRLVYLVALAAGFVAAVAITVALDARRRDPSA
jgi:peptidoglycan/LPS O-acetylase OafA/YrhL